MTRALAELARTVVFILAVWAWMTWLTGCAPGPEGDYRSALDRWDCYVTAGLHDGGVFTTGRVCGGDTWEFTGAWALEGDTVHVSFWDGTAYDVRWTGDALVDATGLTCRRAR